MRVMHWETYIVKEFKVKTDLEFYAYKLLPLLNSSGNILVKELTTSINTAIREWNNRYVKIHNNSPWQTKLIASHTYEMGNKIMLIIEGELPMVIIEGGK